MIKLKETAEILMAVILVVAAFMAGNTAYSEITGTNGSTVLGAVEGVLSGIKTSEVAQIVAKVGPKLAGA